jgi:hypothetical protein
MKEDRRASASLSLVAELGVGSDEWEGNMAQCLAHCCYTTVTKRSLLTPAFVGIL